MDDILNYLGGAFAEHVPVMTALAIIGALAVLFLAWLHWEERKVKAELRRANDALSREIVARRSAEEDLRESESRYRMLVENQGEGICFVGPDDRFLFVNPSGEELFGIAPGKLIGRNIGEFLVPPGHPDIPPFLPECDQKGSYEVEIRRETGELRTMHWNVVPWFSREGRPLGKFGIFRDITEQKRSERRIAETLEERELLLKEIHHRVRTNMQVICSLLNLHSNSVHDEGSRKILRDSQDRIRSMALAHETLYHAPDFCHIDFGQYADGLCRSLLRAYEATQIRVEVVAQGIFVTLDTAVHLGLILNEIISNALKHAFPLGRPGLIRIGMNTEGGTTHLLLVQDDGVGLPDSVDCRNPDSLGLQIIATMVEQLQGSLRVDVDHGTAYRMKLHIQPHQA